MKRRWFFHFFRRSLSLRKGRAVIASLSVMLAVTIVTGMIGITSGIREKLGSELKAYGANIIISPRKGDLVPYEMLKKISDMDGVRDAAGQVFATVFINKEAIEVIGLDTGRLRERGWRISGNLPAEDDEALAGVNIMKVLRLEAGDVVSISAGNRSMGLRVSGFVERGGAEDSSLIMPIQGAWELTGSDDTLSAILVRGDAGELEGIVSRIHNEFPEVRAKTFRQVAFAEEALLVKIQLLMALVMVVVIFAAAVSVASTMGANVLERRAEIGLMKAIGATSREIKYFYEAEAVLIGLLGGSAGCILGFAAAQAVSKGAFNSYISIIWYLPFESLAIGLAVALSASYFPVRDVLKYNPAVILREK